MMISVLMLSPSFQIRLMVVLLLMVIVLQKFARIGDMPCQRGGGDGGGTAQVDLRGGIAHAPGKIAVHGGQRAFAGSQNAEVPPDTGPAAGRANGGAGFDKRLDIAPAQSL